MTIKIPILGAIFPGIMNLTMHNVSNIRERQHIKSKLVPTPDENQSSRNIVILSDHPAEK